MQNSGNDQLSIILKNVLNPDSNIRIASENQITQFLSQNFGEFLVELSKKISTEEEDKQVRQVSSTIIKNFVNNVNYTQNWFKLQDEIKKVIKQNILSTLASKDVDIRKAAALSLAGICKIEIPKKQWLNIFDILISTAQNNDINIQLSSLTALEYIYEEINPGNIPNETVAALLNTYYSLLSKDNNPIQLAINTLNSVQKFLPFIKSFIIESVQRLKFFDIIEKYVENDSDKIRQLGLKIFIEICRIYYDYIQEYIEKIFHFTNIIIEKDIESNKILSLEIWRTIGIEENNRINEKNDSNLKKQSHNFLKKYYKELGEICLKYIVTEDYDNDEDSLSKACSQVILLMSRCCQYDFLNIMINYIGENINNSSEKLKYAALNVFLSITFTVHKDLFYGIVKDSLKMVSETLLNNNTPSHFKKLCANIIKSISKNYSEELVNDTIYFDKMMQLYFQLLKISTKEVLYIIIISINNLCKKVDWADNDQTNILSKYMQALCEYLLNFCSNFDYYSSDNNIAFASFLLLGTLGEHAAMDVKAQMAIIFKLLAEMFEKTLNNSNFPSKEICYNYQEYIASTLSSFLSSENADKNSVGKLLECIIKSFEQRKDLYDEGLYLIGNISLYTKKDFNSVMKIVSPCLIKGLKSHDSPSIIKSSIYCLSDIIRGLENEFNYINEYLPLILDILSDNTIDESLKPTCFLIISDIFVCCQNDAFKYFESIMKVVGEAMMATQINYDMDNLDQDTYHYIGKLRENIVETITCIFTAIKDNNKTKEFIPYVNPIIKYISFIASDLGCTLDAIKGGLFLIGDFCDIYKGDIKPFLDFELIKKMFNRIESDKNEMNDDFTKTGLDWTKKKIEELYQK